MVEGGKIWVFGVLVSLILMRVAGGAEGTGLDPCNFPAVYNFGDSNSDTGAFSVAVSPTQLPDGQTFFGKPAGRGCDGRLIIDFIAEELGIPYLSPYLDSVGSNFSHGANFAYGGATILRQTWQSPGIPFHLAVQATQFSQFKARTIDIYNQGKNISRLPRPEDFSKALYTLDIGQNDVYTSAWSSNPLSLIPDLINNFTLALQTLYDQGGRAFWIHNVGPNGCLPAAQNYIWNRTQETFDKNGCINSWNERVVEFNRQLKDRVIKLRAQLPEAAITYVDVYTAKYNLISNAKNLGFTEPLKQCKNGTTPCENPSSYISWDGVHYTEAANHFVAKNILNGSLSDPPVSIAHACHRNVSM
ncbi:GDSL esterase/lipase At5g14450-like isoform X1 [Rhododendron vialii]|uniref:GDSL esterase/lipase At5g14450-like isoform X1 n=1 Tax=Rhododendron vialii TaxID=182163 RepID=UPI00265F3F1F|nr:GDSL esterase/lipase At5g14450-like isoform X1 [Rhododendron vialii]